MKIDFSTLLLVVLCVIPGLFAQRSRRMICPRSFDAQGAAAELGELVALGISTHAVIVLLGGFVAFLASLLINRNPLAGFWAFDRWNARVWTTQHPAETAVDATAYVFFSFGVSHWLGVFYGLWQRQRSPITARLLEKATWFQKLGITGLLGERPIVYDTMTATITADGRFSSVFVELEMKNAAGFYTGQVSAFSILPDEEPHKPIYLINAWFKQTASEEYAEIAGDGILIDLADATTVQIKRVFPEVTTTSDD